VCRRLGVPVCFPQTANTDSLAHVDVAGHSGGADVEPVDVLGRQLLGVWKWISDCDKYVWLLETYAMS
jgi:hypothetical protein